MLKLIDKNRYTKNNWGIDRRPGYLSPYLGQGKDGSIPASFEDGSTEGKAIPAKMHDAPRGYTLSSTWQFETCAVCAEGPDKGKRYGCVSWGFEVGSNPKSIKSATPSVAEKPSDDWNDAAKKWNDQKASPGGESFNQIPSEF